MTRATTATTNGAQPTAARVRRMVWWCRSCWSCRARPGRGDSRSAVIGPESTVLARSASRGHRCVAVRARRRRSHLVAATAAASLPRNAVRRPPRVAAGSDGTPDLAEIDIDCPRCGQPVPDASVLRQVRGIAARPERGGRPPRIVRGGAGRIGEPGRALLDAAAAASGRRSRRLSHRLRRRVRGVARARRCRGVPGRPRGRGSPRPGARCPLRLFRRHLRGDAAPGHRLHDALGCRVGDRLRRCDLGTRGHRRPLRRGSGPRHRPVRGRRCLSRERS